MKRLLIILFCLPLLFACQKDEPFEEGQEVVLNLSVDMGDMQSAATRAMGDNVEGTPALWLAVFDGEGYLVEWTKAFDCATNNDGVTTFKATLHATMEKRVMHFLLNYVDNSAELELNYGHENNVIGGLTVERNRDVYWQRVELPEGINGSTDQNGTVAKYLTKVPLVRNFSKIKVTEACDHFELLGFYVLNVPKRGTVAPFINGSFVKYYNENAQFNGAPFTPKNYATLNTEGYTGTMPDNDERINKHTEFTESTTLLDKDASYYLYESTYINGNKDKTVSVLLKGKYNDKDYWYRVDLVKPDAQTGVIEYFDVLRNFIYTINITHVTAGKTSAKDAIEQPAGNNILSSLDIAHLTNVSDGTATLEVNYTDTVLISNDEVTVRYKFTDTGSGAKTNANIASANDNDGCGWYLTYDGQTAPVGVTIAGNNSADGWRDVTISVNDATITERKEVSITFFATSSTQTVLSRTVHYTLMSQQPMLVECPELVPATVGSEFNVNILIPDELPEAMFPLDFAIESQEKDKTDYLAQYITPANRETVSVKTGGSIVEGFKGKKSFQYVVPLTYEKYLQLKVETRNVNNQNKSMRVLPTLFKTNTAQSASTVYAYNRYFTLGKDNFANINLRAVFTTDNTNYYGVGRTATLEIQSDKVGTYTLSSETFDLDNATRNVSDNFTLAANATKKINLKTNSFGNQGKVKLNCTIDGVKFEYEVRASERNTIKLGQLTFTRGTNNRSVADNAAITISNDGEDLEVKTHTALKNGTDLIAPGLTSETDGSFKFRYTYNNDDYESTSSYSYQDLIVTQTINLRN